MCMSSERSDALNTELEVKGSYVNARLPRDNKRLRSLLF